ncbi:ribonuclease P protein component [Nakamurella sp. YIM 132087]|uniref:Ribonuclease P protein component n=1 Tax=Nakamurella alba TaxID=2665158 RepID=A0A7K1FQC2_9ACTN|nr:ribonuclease P protein component [Nakamurella alba]MTD14994.1 ribonuclease P protein component [Nakamurella alba]
MLPTAARLHTSGEFAAVVRSGRRAGTRRLVVHLLTTDRQMPARAGFVVSGKIGGSVVRHRITRRLRPIVRERLATLPPGTDLVIRALPAAADADSAALASDLGSGIASALRKAAR